ncbi:hypothetical protein [Thiocystis violacea]|uniref:hypothetical protein n=1 Tax=Thiocystis violacea TaxID=13725 RepID=UPI0019084124|nr:hypothetical protein [Thiocystis violacea]MBK1716054.1 hypothetical protein [Thiocystis violacea]
MKMQNVDITRYPKFALYVKKSIPTIMESKAIVRAMQEIGQLDRATLQRAVKWGEGPDIQVVVLAGAYGEFTPDTNSNEIRINKGLVEDFEAGRGVRKTKSGKNVYLVGVTLLHELVHWGDDKDGIDRAGEEGEEFERRVYGQVID